MNAQTLSERYVYAVVRAVPEKQRDDVAAELRASIADQVDARTDGGEPHEDAERAVLTELGDPAKLAAGYADRPLHLIGPRYFLAWWRLLKLLLAIVPAAAAFGVALGQVLAGATVGEVIGSVVSVVFSVVVHLAFWVTLVFAVLERSGERAGSDLLAPWTPDQLPEQPDRGAGLSDLIASLVFLLAAAGAILWDHFLGLAYVGGEWISVLHVDLWPWWIAALFALMAGEALLAITVYARRRWTFGLAGVNALLNVAIAVPALVLLAQDRLIDSALVAATIDTGGGDLRSVLVVLTGFAIVAVAVWDSVDAFLKARRAR